MSTIIHTGGNVHTNATAGATIVFDALNLQDHAPPFDWTTSQCVYRFVPASNKLDFRAFVTTPVMDGNVHIATNIPRPMKFGYPVASTGQDEIYLVSEGPEPRNNFVFHNGPDGHQTFVGTLIDVDLSHGILLA